MHLRPGGGFGIFTDRDQRSNFGGFEFRKSVFLVVLVTAAVFFALTKKCYIFKYITFSITFGGLDLFTRYFSKHSSSLLLYCA